MQTSKGTAFTAPSIQQIVYPTSPGYSPVKIIISIPRFIRERKCGQHSPYFVGVVNFDNVVS